MRGTVVDLSSMTPDNTKELNQIAQGLREPYTEFIDSLSITYGEEPFWWDTPLVSRNSHICTCFYDICLLKLALQIIDREQPRVLVVPGQKHKNAIENNAIRYIPKIVVAEGFKSRVKRRILEEYSYFSFKRYITKLQEQDCLTTMQKYRGRNLTLISSPVIPSEIINESYVSRYYPGLSDYGLADIVFLLHFVSDGLQNHIKSYISRSIQNRKDLLFFEQYADMSAFKEIENYTRWCRRFQVADCWIDGMEVGGLVNGALIDGGQDITAMKGILWGQSICRLVEQYDLKIQCLIDWYEGQPSSNAMIRRFRAKLPDVPTVAYATSPYEENNLGMYPSRQQVVQKIVPEYYGVIGKIWVNQIRQFSKDVKCVAAPALRHKEMFDKTMETSMKRKGVLLVLPYFIDAATQLLQAFGEAIHGLDTESIGPIYIKNHPVHQGHRISDYGVDECFFQKWDVNYLVGDLYEAMRGKAIIVLSKTTSTLETMLNGAYTINFIPAGDLSLNALPEEATVRMSVVYGSEDLHACLQNPKSGLSDEEAIWLRDVAFIPVNQESVNDFFKLQDICYA